MRTILACTAAASLVAIVSACKKQDDASPQPTANPTATAAYSAYPGAPPLPPGQPQPAPAYVQAPQQQPVAPGTSPVPPAPPSGQMAVPGPIAFQCQNDVPCGMHRCNLQYGKCAFPCQTNVDCLSPNTCMTGLCVPAGLLKSPGSP